MPNPVLARRPERSMKTPSARKEGLRWGRKASRQVWEENLVLIEVCGLGEGGSSFVGWSGKDSRKRRPFSFVLK